MEMLKIYTRNLELTEHIREYVEKKIERFERYLQTIDSIRVDLSETNARDPSRRMVAQVTIYVPRAILRAEERSGDIFAALDAVVDKMYRRIERYKGRKRGKRGTVTPKTITIPDMEELEEETFVPEIARVKEFEVSSTTPEDAIDQMELLGHHFYVFLDGTDGRLSVVYRRESGDYGLLKPIY
jgi:putative sigma-54 modulation protein